MNFKYIFIFITVIIFAASCSSRHIKYIQDKSEILGTNQTEFPNQPPNYKLKPHDILFVKISTTNKEINELFASGFNNNNSFQNQVTTNSYLSGYSVNDTGYVYVPIIGLIKVIDLTINQVQELFKAKVDELLIDAFVNVKLVSFKITFLGEFSSQGIMYFYQDEVNVLDAIAQRGGITDYGNKKNILVVRKTESGTKVFRIDVTERGILQSQDFYLLPNDILYAEPVRSKMFRLAIADYSLFITLITSTISTLLIVSNFVK